VDNNSTDIDNEISRVSLGLCSVCRSFKKRQVCV